MVDEARRGSIAFVTMGCAKNEVDTSDMARALEEAGYACDAAPIEADVVIINTCSFIQAATEESIDAVLEACELPRVKDGSCSVVVAGCMPARYGRDLECELPEVAAFVSCHDEEGIVARVNAVLGNEQSEVGAALVSPSHNRIEGEPFAYVKISDGCDRFCSYCTIPLIRGRYHSFPLDQIMEDTRRAVDAGAREIVLIAQDTGRWGSDLPDAPDLAFLLESLAGKFPRARFRVMYIQPEGVTERLLDTMARYDNLCEYLDIPFQHSSPTLLHAMNRKGSAEEYLSLIERIRKTMPEVALRTTLMVGFPGETEEDFDDLKDFVEEAALDYVGLFAYSREEGTRADKLAGHIDENVKADRLQELRDLADAISSGVIAKRVGSVQSLLVCGQEEDGQWYGRTASQAPDVDGITFASPEDGADSASLSLSVGDIIPVKIDDALLYDMEGHPVDG